MYSKNKIPKIGSISSKSPLDTSPLEQSVVGNHQPEPANFPCYNMFVSDLKTLKTYQTRIEAEAAKGLLDASKIHSVVVADDEGRYGTFSDANFLIWS